MNILLLKLKNPTGTSYTCDRLAEHMGLGYIAAVLRRHGYVVTLWDLNAQDFTIANVVARIKKGEFGFVGLSIPFQCGIADALDFVKLVRAKGYKGFLAVGGHPPTFMYREILELSPGIDCIVRGEGEFSVLSLVKTLSNKCDWTHQKGLVYRNGANICSTPSCEPVEDLNALPFPARDSYKQFRKNNLSLPMAIITSRGCYKKCNFCDIQVFYSSFSGLKYRRRSAFNIVEEIKLGIEKYKISRFHFADDNFLAGGKQSHAWLYELIEEIKKLNVKIEFNIVCCAEDVDKNLFQAMQDIGLNRVFLGIESWITRTARLLGKPTNPTIARNALNILNDLKITIQCGSIFADPETTIYELEKNYSQWRELNLFSPDSCARLEVYEGTPLCETLKKKDLITRKGFVYDYEFKDVKVKVAMQIIESLRIDHFIPMIRRSGKFLSTLKRRTDTLSPDKNILLRELISEVEIFVEKLHKEYFADCTNLIIESVQSPNIAYKTIKVNLEKRINDIKYKWQQYKLKVKSLFS